MGVVYKARDPLIGRLVALKTITSGLAEQADMLERFYREAQAAGGLQHPNIVTIYDLGEEQKTPYIAMEFLEGISLEKIIEDQERLPLSQKIGYMAQVCRALDYAHKRGVVHRDIKPANIVVLRDGTIKVVDFGIARLVDTSRSQTGLLIGTVNYMSPEQVRGERVDGRSDIFSLGVMFYELMSYQRPFQGANFTAVMLAIISQEHTPLSKVAPDCPADLDPILNKVLKKDANERYQSLEEVLLDLEPLYRRLQQETVSGIVAETHQLIQSKELEKARDLLRQALLIDTTHREAKTLLEKVNAELKRSLVVPKLKDHVTKGKDLLKEGKLPEAQAEAEAALKLDSVYEPAQELIKQIQKETDKAKLAKDWLKTAQQQMAEGNLTEADQQLEKLLEMDSKNPQAQKLKKQVAEEKERRAKRQRLLDTMQRARNLWTQQKYDECIELLNALQKDFPGEDEVAKLLETVRSDQAEQQKHEKLTEARRLLGEQHFAESLQILDGLLERNPNETGIQKLRAHVVQERKDHAQRVRLQHEQQALKKLINEESYTEAVAKGDQLLREFPDDFELSRMVEYARSQQAQIDHARRLKEKIQELDSLLAKGSYDQAVAVGEKALDSFPGNLEIIHLLDDARAKHKDKEKKDYVEKQIRAIKGAIDRGELTDAIDMGRQTLAVVKSDTDVTRLLQFAQREHELRAQQRETDSQLKTAIFLLESKKFDEATKVLEDVQKTSIFDPRVHSLLEAAKAKEVPKDLATIDKTIVGVSGVSPEQQYVLQQVPRAPGAAPPADDTLVGMKASAPVAEPVPSVTPVPAPPVAPPEHKPAAPAGEPAVTQPVLPKPPAAPPVKQKPLVEEPPVKKKKGKPEVEEEPVRAKPAVEEPPVAKPPAKPPVEPPPVARPPAEPPAKPKPPVEAPPKPKPAVEPPVARPSLAPPVPVEVPRPFLKSPAGMAVIGVLVVALGVGGYLFMSKGTPDTAPGTTTGTGTTTGAQPAGPSPEQQQRDLFEAANALADKEDYTGAVVKIDEALKLQGALQPQLRKLRTQMETGAKNAAIWKQEKTLFDQAVGLFNQNQFDKAEVAFKKVAAIKEGRRGADVQRYSELIPTRKQEEKSLTDAKKLWNSNNPGDLQTAKGLLEFVARGSGPRKLEAQDLLGKVQGKLDQLGKDALISGAQSAARDALRRGDYLGARQRAEEIKQQGGDPTSLLNEISSAEQNRLSQLTGQFGRLRSAQDTPGLQQLAGEFRRFAEASGNASAKDYAENQIPAAIGDIEKARTEAAASAAASKEKSDFDAAVNAFNQATGAKDRGALRSRVLPQFETIAKGGGSYAQKAQDYVASLIPAEIKRLSPCPPIPVGKAGGMPGAVQPGQTVAVELLESKPAWVQCTLPDFPESARRAGVTSGAARLSLSIDEQGNVVAVKPRGTKDAHGFYEAAAAAAQGWKVTPPKAKGVSVKTDISIDIQFN